MALFADGLRPVGGGSVRDGVISDLASYYGLDSPEEVVRRCIHWEGESIQEWVDAGDAAGDQIANFYASADSWSFDLMWFAYLQTTGYAYPTGVVIMEEVALPEHASILDFGSGVGTSAQLFAARGHDVTLADVSLPLLNFAKWRLDARGVPAKYVELPADMPADCFDAITATDTLAHVPDIAATARRLHTALRAGGLLIVNAFDVRPQAETNAWHLYEDDLPLRWALAAAGFKRKRTIDDQILVYVACPTNGPGWITRKAAAWLRFASPLARILRALRRLIARSAFRGIDRLRNRHVGT